MKHYTISFFIALHFEPVATLSIWHGFYSWHLGRQCFADFPAGTCHDFRFSFIYSGVIFVVVGCGHFVVFQINAWRQVCHNTQKIIRVLQGGHAVKVELQTVTFSQFCKSIIPGQKNTLHIPSAQQVRRGFAHHLTERQSCDLLIFLSQIVNFHACMSLLPSIFLSAVVAIPSHSFLMVGNVQRCFAIIFHSSGTETIFVGFVLKFV